MKEKEELIFSKLKTVKAEKGKKQAKKRRLSSSSSSGKSSSDSSLEPKSDREPTEKRFKRIAKKDEHLYRLPTTMADYANENFNQYIAEGDIDEKILSIHPIPSNLTIDKQLDDFMRPLVSNEYTINCDRMIEFYQRTSQMMGPLCRIWSELEHVRKESSSDNAVEIPVDHLINLMEQTIVIPEQTSNHMLYSRCLNILKNVISDSKRAKVMLTEISELFQDNQTNLFGKKFKDYLDSKRCPFEKALS